MRTPDFVLQSERLSYRAISAADYEELCRLDGDPEVMKYITGGEIRTPDQVKKNLPKALNYIDQNPGFGIFANIISADNTFTGWTCFKHLDKTEMIEVGYRFHKEHWGKGYATECAKAFVRYGFQEKNLDKIVGVTHPENTASQNVLLKAGLRRNSNIFAYGHDLYLFELHRNDWKTQSREG